MLRLYCSNFNRLSRVCRRLQRTSSRKLSSVVPSNDQSHAGRKEKENDVHDVLIYERDPTRNAPTTASFFASSLNSIYWVWYVVDFIPAVNASPLESFHINPLYGFGGLGLSLLIQSAVALYPLSLVSKITYRTSAPSVLSDSDDKPKQKNSTLQQKQDEILVWKHTLPLLRTSSKPIVFPVGGFALDKTSEKTRIILEELGGDVGKFEGHLFLKKVPQKERIHDDSSGSSSGGGGGITANFPLIVDIRNSAEIYDSELMLHMLLLGGNKHYSNNKPTERRTYVEERDTKHRNKFHQQRSKYKKRNRRKGKL